MEKCTIYGIHAVTKILQLHPSIVEQAYIQDHLNPRLKEIQNSLSSHNINIMHVDKNWLHDKTQSQQHQGIALVIRQQTVQGEHELFNELELGHKGYYLALDSVEDPRNLGACIRTAESLGAKGIIFPKDKSAKVTPLVRKVACGAADILPLYQVTNLARTLETAQAYGVWVYGAGWSEQSQGLFETAFYERSIIVMGSEGKGLRKLVAKTCDHMVTIPMMGLTESLNVSVASGIICAELMRQQLCEHQPKG